MGIGLTDSQLKAVVVVGWGNGISETRLADFLKMKLPNCRSNIVKPLILNGIFYYGGKIKTGKRGRPSCLLHLKNNPYLLGDIRNQLENRKRERWAEMRKVDRAYDATHKNQTLGEMGWASFYEAAKLHRESSHFRKEVKLLRKYNECLNLLNAFVQGSTYKNVDNIPAYSLENDEIYPPGNEEDPRYLEYLEIMLSHK